jgi:hypothetical protein
MGRCHDGAVGCDPFGNEACVGQQLPRPETCVTPGDEDCDGVDECPPTTHWVATMAGTGCSYPLDLTIDRAGNALVVGSTQGPLIDLGGGQLLVGPGDLFVTKRDPGGQHLWSHILINANYGRMGVPRGILATDDEGNVLVAGVFRFLLRIGDLTLLHPGSSLFVVKLSPSGEVLWAQGFPVSMSAADEAIALDSAGNVVIAGTFSGTLRFGTTEHTAPGSTAVYVAKLHADTGGPLWSRSFSGPSVLGELGLVVDEADDLLFTGVFGRGSISIDGTSLISEPDLEDVFLTKLEASTGTALWARNVGQPLVVDLSPRIQGDGAGNFLLLTWTPWFASGSTTPTWLNLRKLDSSGEELWSRNHASSLIGFMHPSVNLSLEPSSGRVLVAGSFNDRADFGGGVLTSSRSYNGAPSPFAAWYSASGDYLTARAFPGQFGPSWGYAIGYRARATGDGSVLQLGTLSGTLDLGTGPVQGGSCNSVLLMKFTP